MSESKRSAIDETAEQTAEAATEAATEETKSSDERTAADPAANEDPQTPPKRRGLAAHIQHKTVFFGVFAVVALVCFIIAYNKNFSAFLNNILSILSPILVGCVLAYLCHPLLEFFEYRLFRRMKNKSARRGLSLFLTVVVFFVIIILFVLMIVPELISSLQTLIGNYSDYVNGFLSWFRQFITDTTTKFGLEVAPETIDSIMLSLKEAVGSLGRVFSTVGNWLQKTDISMEFAGNVLTVITNLLKNTVLSLFIAFYILASLDKRKAQLRKFRRAVFNEKQDKKITEIVHLTDRTFSGYLFGVLVDAIVVGVITFIMLAIFEVSPYNMLIAVTMAVTNVIPVFGPFIGAIPSAFIVLITNPSKLILFILLMLIIQQVDGNILCPKIQGDNTGVSSLTVLIAIAIAGSLFGIIGMVIGVPIFAVFIELGKRAIEDRLIAKGEPTDTTVYYPKSALSNAEKDVYYEHAGLRYRYEHSKLKDRFDRLRRDALNLGNSSEARAEAHADKADKTDKKAKTDAESADTSDKDTTDKADGSK